MDPDIPIYSNRLSNRKGGLMEKDDDVFVYVCKTDYDYHIPDDWNGIDIYFSEKSIRTHRKCVKECGIVKMKLTFEEIVDKGEGFCYTENEEE